MVHASELDFIHCIQQYRTPLFDNLFQFFNFIESNDFFVLLLPLVSIIWLTKGWKSGLRLFYILFINNTMNYLIKEIFHSPRPFNLDSGVGIVDAYGFGFPSAAAQTSMLLSLLLITYMKNQWKWVLGMTYLGLMSLSRMYLGVHFPSDILGGWLAGFALWALYIYARPPIEQHLKKLNSIFLLLLSQAIPLFLLMRQDSIPSLHMYGLAMGLGIGLFITNYYRLFLPPPKNVKNSVFRAIIGVAGTFFCYSLILLIPLPDSNICILAQFLVLGLWISSGSSIACRTCTL